MSFPFARDELSGRTLGKYEIACRLSTGGMSEILLAFQRGAAGFRKYVVLKRILDDIKGQEDFVRMLVQEAKLTACFSHSNIAHVFDLDVVDGELILAMEYVPGATLVDIAKECVSASSPIPLGFTLAVVRDTALALHYAHTFTDPAGRRQPVIHRDVAEKNIMVTFDGTTKLLDFGIAKRLDRAGATFVGTIKGTSGYMSPEQIRGEPLDARTDVFSLGVVLHECLVGQRLFFRRERDEEIQAALTQEVVPPSRRNREVSPELDAVVLKALAKDREARFATARELAKALERVGGALLWEQDAIASFVRGMFAERREKTRALLSAVLDEDESSDAPAPRPLGEPPAPTPTRLDRPLLVSIERQLGEGRDDPTRKLPAAPKPEATFPWVPEISSETPAVGTPLDEDEEENTLTTDPRLTKAAPSPRRSRELGALVRGPAAMAVLGAATGAALVTALYWLVR